MLGLVLQPCKRNLAFTHIKGKHLSPVFSQALLLSFRLLTPPYHHRLHLDPLVRQEAGWGLWELVTISTKMFLSTVPSRMLPLHQCCVLIGAAVPSGISVSSSMDFPQATVNICYTTMEHHLLFLSPCLSMSSSTLRFSKRQNFPTMQGCTCLPLLFPNLCQNH